MAIASRLHRHRHKQILDFIQPSLWFVCKRLCAYLFVRRIAAYMSKCLQSEFFLDIWNNLEDSHTHRNTQTKRTLAFTSMSLANCCIKKHIHTHANIHFTPHDPLLCWLCSCLPLRSGTPDDWRPRYGLLLPHFLLSSAIPSSPTSSPPHSQFPVSLPYTSPPGARGSCLSRHWTKVSYFL